jgi:hypothetical protein
MALHTDCRTALSPYRGVSSDETLMRLIRYPGARSSRSPTIRISGDGGGHGSVDISVLGANRKNLLRIDWSKL